MAKPYMYKEAQVTKNYVVGCLHDCIYCKSSFQRLAKRRKKWCLDCYNYTPHSHLKRLKQPLPKSLPNGQFVFLNDMGDVAFARREWMIPQFDKIREYPNVDFLIQSKNPICFHQYLDVLPENVILGTTIETNKIEFETPSKYHHYREISKAPYPGVRYLDMSMLLLRRKIVTHEPLLDFDLKTLVTWDRLIEPIIIYVGYDNHSCYLPEPRVSKTERLITELEKITTVRRKTIRKAWWET